MYRYYNNRSCSGTKIHEAVNSLDLQQLESSLSEHSGDIDTVDKFSRTALHWAVSRNFETGVNLLLKSGTNVNVRDRAGQTPLIYAVKKARTEIVSILLQKSSKVNIADNYGQTALHIAAKYCDVSMVKLLLSKSAKVNVKDNDDDTPLHLALRKHPNCYDTVRKLLRNGAAVNAVNTYSKTPLHVALASYRDCSLLIVRELLNYGASILARDSDGETPIYLSTFHKHSPEVFCDFVDRGVDINVKTDSGTTPLHIACQGGCKLFIDILCANGVDISAKDLTGNTALHYSSIMGHEEVVEKLLALGAEVNIRNDYDETPLHWAAKFVDRGFGTCVIQNLLDWGASMTTLDKEFSRPLGHSACNVIKTSGEIEKHFVKVKCAKLPVDENLNFDQNKFDDFKASCEEELKKMQTSKFDRHSLYDVFGKYHDPTFISNKDLEASIKSFVLKSEFPIYASLLNVTFVKAKHRVALLNTLQYSLQIPLPNEIKRNILSYLTNEELQTIWESDEMLSSNKLGSGGAWSLLKSASFMGTFWHGVKKLNIFNVKK